MTVAVRVDPATGVEERVEFVNGRHGALYTWTALPADSRCCVVVCSSLFAELLANYHRERLLGRALAANGCGVIRFHYAGEANSFGARTDMTFATLCDDAETMLERAAACGFTEFALLGTRLGALVAAAVLRPMPGVPLALWEPMADPQDLVRQAQRAKRMSSVASGTQAKTWWSEELATNGSIDLFGYDVHAPLVESFAGVDLLSLLGSQHRPVFLARFRRQANTVDPVADALARRGFPVTAADAVVSESWWLQSERVVDHGDLIASTATWLCRELAR